MKSLFFLISFLSVLGYPAQAADIKLSQLPLSSAASTGPDDSFPFVNATAGATQRLTLADIVNLPAMVSTYVSSTDPVFTGNATFSGGVGLTSNMAIGSSTPFGDTSLYVNAPSTQYGNFSSQWSIVGNAHCSATATTKCTGGAFVVQTAPGSTVGAGYGLFVDAVGLGSGGTMGHYFGLNLAGDTPAGSAQSYAIITNGPAQSSFGGNLIANGTNNLFNKSSSSAGLGGAIEAENTGGTYSGILTPDGRGFRIATADFDNSTTGSVFSESLGAGSGNTYSRIQSYTNGGSVSNTAVISLQPDGGNVGIGTVTPSQALSVNGNVNISGLTASEAVVTDASKNLTSLPYASANTVSSLVERDSSGNFTAGTITAALTGHASLDVAISSLSNLTDTGTDGLIVTGGSGAVVGAVSLSQHVADTTHNGYLSSTDWNSFSTGAGISFGIFGSTPNNNGASILSGVITLQPADATHPGGISTAAQTIAGQKTFSSAPILSSLTASLPLQTDASKNVISSAIDLSGSQATGTLAAARFPALTGDVTTIAGNLTTTVSKIAGTTVSGTTGTGNSVFDTSPTLISPNLGTPTTLVGTNISGVASSLSSGNVVTTATNSTNATFFPSFVASSSSGNQGIDTATGLTFNPSSNILSTTTFSGALSGNATTATTATTAGSFSGNLVGDVTGTQGATVLSKIGAFSAGSIPFIGAAGVISQDNNNLFWDNTHKRLGISNPSPLVPVDIAGTNLALTLRTSDSNESSTGGSSISVATNSATPQPSGSRLGQFEFGGAPGSTSVENYAASIQGFATETWSGTANGSKLVLSTTGNTTLTQNTVLTLGQDKSATFTGTINSAALTASLPVQTDSSKNLISSAIDLSGSQATGTLAAGRFPALTGGVTTTAGSLTATVITNANLSGPISSSGNTTSITSQTGTGTTFAMSASPTFTGTVGAAAITASGNINNTVLTASLPVQTDASKNLISSAIDLSGAQATGTLATARLPAFTGDFTTSAGSSVTTAAATQANIVTLSKSTGVAVHGTNTNDNAAAGYKGEYLQAVTLRTSAVTLTSTAFSSVISGGLTLTTGDWDVCGDVGYTGTSSTITQLEAVISSNNTNFTVPTNTYGATDVRDVAISTFGLSTGSMNANNGDIVSPLSCYRASLSGSETVYLMVNNTFTAGTMSAYGRLTARRSAH